MATASPSEPTASIERLQAAADAAANSAARHYVTFLLFGLYLAITVGATTHELLLRSDPVELPILGVRIPLFGFYWVAPALFVLLHFNLLTQLCLLSDKLHRLDAAMGRSLKADGRRETLNTFVFSQMLIGGHRGHMAVVLALMVWTTVVFLPLVLLLFVQIRFLPYHDLWTTYWHRLLVLADLFLLWLLWASAIERTGRLNRRLRARLRLLRGRGGLRARLSLFVRRSIRPVSNAAAAIWRRPTALWARVRGSGSPPRVRHATRSARLGWRFRALRGSTYLTAATALFIATIPEEPVLGVPVDALLDSSRSPPLIARNLVVRETHLVRTWPTGEQIRRFGETLAWEYFGDPVVLAGRDLRFGEFHRSILVHADLREADLRGANLMDANLQGANLMNAKLASARLMEARLQGATLLGADLKHANLRLANLDDTVLRKTNFQGALLDGASLQGAFLDSNDLQGASLIGANLQGAQVLQLVFPPERPGPINLQGANLTVANLQGIRLGYAYVQGARLFGANLLGADISDAKLQGADMRGVRLWRATLPHDAARLAYVDLRGAITDPPSHDEIEEWRQIAKDLPKEARAAVEQVWRTFEENLDQDGTPEFPEVWGSTTNILFDRDEHYADGWAEPPTIKKFDKYLATLLIELVCAENASRAIAERIAWRIILEATRMEPPIVTARIEERINIGVWKSSAQPDERRSYWGIVAKALVDGGEDCSITSDLSRDVIDILAIIAGTAAEEQPALEGPAGGDPGTPASGPQAVVPGQQVR
jgi:uncharacterized protein YjbI with pentapeptide repeats